MSVVLTTFEAFRGKDCPLETCVSTGLYYADPACSWSTVWKAAQCGIAAMEKNATDIRDAGSTTLWSEDGDFTLVPDIQLFKHVLHESSGSDGIENVLGFGSMDDSTIDADFHNAEAESWCLPIRGGFVDLWLDSEISGESMSSGSTTNSSDVATTNNEATTSISGTTIVLVVLFILLGITIGVILTVRKKRDVVDVAPSPTIYESVTSTTRYKRNATRMSSPRNSINMRRSMELAIFCIDAKITAKRISYDSLSFDKLIARGANGEVWRGTCGSQIVAIKQLLPEKRHDEGNVMLFSNEVRLASALEHPNIVQFIGLSWNRVCDLCIVSEFMEQGDLSMLLNSNRKDDLTWHKEKLEIATDIADALAYLHGRQPIIIHRDLKSLNVLLDNHLRAKLSDFGLSRERSSDDTMTNGVGTLLWTAPEILRGEAYSEKADVYSYAIVLSELDTCLPPFALNTEVSERRMTTMQLMHLATSGEVSPQLRDNCPRSLQQLTAACSSFEPSQRPNALEIVFTLRNIARNMNFDPNL
ncbi:unnamed protein product [Peronospora farinosa]|uniref:Protein kinase domain-containing protein n=2 Tax=Peronospora farinosa TaxID=134698 RepID=A0ABN8CD21_9STRA|nr:unnamed protein product [Peronospora farinosa]